MLIKTIVACAKEQIHEVNLPFHAKSADFFYRINMNGSLLRIRLLKNADGDVVHAGMEVIEKIDEFYGAEVLTAQVCTQKEVALAAQQAVQFLDSILNETTAHQ